MKYLVTILALALAPAAALAQKASAAETKAVGAIVECLLEGLPAEWKRVEMVIELAKPGAETGDVQYTVVNDADEKAPFTPCDLRTPARTLLELRKSQPPKRRGWTAARLALTPDGNFQLNFDYPK